MDSTKEYFTTDPASKISVSHQLLFEFVKNGGKRLTQAQINLLMQFSFIDMKYDNKGNGQFILTPSAHEALQQKEYG